MQLNPVSLSQKTDIEKIFRTENSFSADYCFGNIYMWDKRYKQQLAVVGNRLVTLICGMGEEYFSFPVGSGDIFPTFDEMRSFCRERGIMLRLCGITEEHKALMEIAFPDVFSYTPMRNNFDYIYSIDSLAAYPGKHLHAKKNHCNKFENENEWHFAELCSELIPDCIGMLDKWSEKEAERLDKSITAEHDAILRGFEHFDELNLEGGVLFVNGKVAGFAIGERLSDTCFCEHFEKAYTDIPGAYPMVCREFAKLIKQKHPDVCYVNREDDLGSMNLRKSKLSYKPENLLIKYTAVEL